jgi:hypothetical protein
MLECTLDKAFEGLRSRVRENDHGLRASLTAGQRKGAPHLRDVGTSLLVVVNDRKLGHLFNRADNSREAMPERKQKPDFDSSDLFYR